MVENVTKSFKMKDNFTYLPDSFDGLLHSFRGGQIMIVLCIVESCMILVANTSVFLLIIKYKKLRRKNNYCIISLAISDFLTGLVPLPLVLVCSYELNACVPMDLSLRFLSFSTVLHLLVATGERYFKIRYPLRYKYHVTGARIGLILAAVWVLSLVLSLIQLVWIYQSEQSNSYDLIFSISCVVVFAFFPFLITIFANIHVLWIIRKEKKIRYGMVSQEQGSDSHKSNKSNKRRSRERKAVLVYLSMTVSFMVGFLPYFILTTLHDVQHLVSFGVSLLLLILKFTAPLVDPLLYTFFKTDFNAAFKDMVYSKPEPTPERTVHTRV